MNGQPRVGRSFRLSLTALVAWVGMAVLGELAVPSAVNKTITNLWACRVSLGGPWITEELADGTSLTSSLIGYTLVPNSAETQVDAALRGSRGRSTVDFFREHAWEISCLYVQHLQDTLTSGFRGLRQRMGDLVPALFSVQLLLCLAGRDCRPGHTFALAGAALGQYFGPVILIAGSEPTHYVLVLYPLVVLIAARGAARLAETVQFGWERWRTYRQAARRPALGFVAGISLLLVAISSALFYQHAWMQLRGLNELADRQQVEIDALGLEGRNVACRNMGWFVDRPVQTVFLPYATVPELERYVQAHAIDGILLWENEPMAAFRAHPYGSVAALGRALQGSPVFDIPRVSGGWRWYPVRRPYSEAQP